MEVNSDQLAGIIILLIAGIIATIVCYNVFVVDPRNERQKKESKKAEEKRLEDLREKQKSVLKKTFPNKIPIVVIEKGKDTKDSDYESIVIHGLLSFGLSVNILSREFLKELRECKIPETLRDDIEYVLVIVFGVEKSSSYKICTIDFRLLKKEEGQFDIIVADVYPRPNTPSVVVSWMIESIADTLIERSN